MPLVAVLALLGCGAPQRPDVVPEASTAPQPLSGTIALKAANGKFITADQADGIPHWGALMANRDSIGAWERFEVQPRTGGRYALRASNARYVSGEREGLFQAVADRDSIGEWELFELQEMPGGGYALRTTEGRYLAVELAEGAACPLCIVADRAQAGPWETFEVLRLEPMP